MGNLAANPGNQLSNGPTPNQIPNLESLGLGGNPGTVQGPYGGQVTVDKDGRGFTNADGGHDWNVGQGPGGNWNGEDQKTGQSPVGQDPGSGDALGYPRGSAQYNQATQAHQAWIQQNRAAGRTLADLGMSPTRGGGLSNYMQFAGTPRGPVSNTPGNPSPNGTIYPVPKDQTPEGAQKRYKPTNSLGLASGGLAAPTGNTTVQGQMSYGGINNGMSSLGMGNLTSPMNSLNQFGQQTPQNPYPNKGRPIPGMTTTTPQRQNPFNSLGMNQGMNTGQVNSTRINPNRVI